MDVGYWMQFKEQIEMAVPVIALCLSVLSIVITAFSMWTQRVHNIRAIMPFPFFSLSDYENLIDVSLQNKGAGTFIVEKIIVRPTERSRAPAFASLLELMAADTDVHKWDEFVVFVKGRPIQPGDSISLLRLSDGTGLADFEHAKRAVRLALKPYTIEVHGRDVYKVAYSAQRNLDWFGRTLINESEAKSRSVPDRPKGM